MFFAPHTYAQTKVYTGKIDNKYEIEMHLITVKDGTYGYYVYKNKNVPIPLYLDGKKKQQLIEGDPYDDIYFAIDAYGKTISGTWNDHRGKKSFPFSVTQTGTETVSNSIAGYATEYGIEKKEYVKGLGIQPINNKYVYFEITVGSESCVGHLSGIAKITGPGKTVFKDGNCTLNFIFGNKQATLTETDCAMHHGLHCDFTGVYKSK